MWSVNKTDTSCLLTCGHHKMNSPKSEVTGHDGGGGEQQTNFDLMPGDECVFRSGALLLHLMKVPLIFSPSFHEPLKVPSSWSPVGSVSVP